MEKQLLPEFNSAFNYGWDVMKKNFWIFMGILLVSSIIGAIPSIFSKMGWVNKDIFQSLYWILISGPISFGYSWVFLKAVRQEHFEFKDMFAAFGPNYWNVLVANLLLAVILGLGFILLIIPGIYLACKLVFVPYLVMDKQMKFSDAFSASWDMSKGYGWTIFGMGLMSILMAIVGLLLLIVGIYPALALINSSFAALYYAIENKGQEAEVIEV